MSVTFTKSRYGQDAANVVAYMERKAALKFSNERSDEAWPFYKSDQGTLTCELTRAGFKWTLDNKPISGRLKACDLIAERMERTLK